MRGFDSHSPPRVGVITALPQEARVFGIATTISSIQRISATVVVATSGVGDDLARKSAQALADIGVRAIVSFGSAAGLSPDLRPGDLVLPDRIVMQSDDECAYVTPSWHLLLEQRLALTHSKSQVDSVTRRNTSLLQLSEVISKPDQKAMVFQHSGCVAADMESAAVAQVCAQRGIAFVVIRVVSDDAQTCIPSCVISSLDTQGNLSLAKLGLALVLKPWQIAGLLRLGVGFIRAKKTLSAIVSELGVDFAFPESSS